MRGFRLRTTVNAGVQKCILFLFLFIIIMTRAAAQDPEQVTTFLMVPLLEMFDLGLFCITNKNWTFLSLFASVRQTGICHWDIVLSPKMSGICMLFRLAMSRPLWFPLTSQSILILV